MLIALSKIRIKTGHFAKVLPFIRENAEMGKNKPGCLSTYVATNEENKDEIILYTLWQDNDTFEEAKKGLKRDTKIRKLALQLLPHLAQEPKLEIYEVIPL